MSEAVQHPLELLATVPHGTKTPCVDCGLITGNFCDGGPSVGYDKCFAADRVPEDYTYAAIDDNKPRTPLCTYCETRFQFCRFCRGVKGCTPPIRRRHWSGVPLGGSRNFDEIRARLSIEREFAERRARNVDQERQDEDDRRLQQHLETEDFIMIPDPTTTNSSSSNMPQ